MVVQRFKVKQAWHRLLRRFSRDPAASSVLAALPPEGVEGVAVMGHRNYVGGMWDEIGQLQYDFLIQNGLQPSDVLLDIACGALRLGVKVIPYLDPGNYLGIEKEESLIQAAVAHEISAEVLSQKQPQILCDSNFAIQRFGKCVDVAIAQSLFTHLPPALIEQCLQNLRPYLKATGKFYATYFEVEIERTNPDEPHDHGYFAYTKQQMQAFCSKFGYRMQYVGDWSHPRGQVMVVYLPA